MAKTQEKKDELLNQQQADQSVDQPSGIVVRRAVAPTSIVAAVRQAIWSVDKNQPVARVQIIEDIYE